MKSDLLDETYSYLKTENESLKAENILLKSSIQSLQEQINLLRKMLFGKSSEKFVPTSDGQMLLFEDSTMEKETPAETIQVPAHEKKKAKSTPINTISFPDDLPVETVVLDLGIEEKTDPKTGSPLVKIGEEVTRRLAVKPQTFFVKEIIRYKYAVASNPDAGIQTPYLPSSILNRPACDESFVADVIVKKFCDHLPLNRQSEILTRQKIYVSRQTLSSYVNKIGEGLERLYNLMVEDVLESKNIFVDETPVDELSPGKGSTHQAYVVTMVGGKSLDPGNRVYLYFANRKHANFIEALENYSGVLHSDKYGAYEALAIKKKMTWCPCYVHMRRKFFEAESGDRKFRDEILELFNQLFESERQAANLEEAERLVFRKENQESLIDRLIHKCQSQLGKELPKSKIREAIGYFLGLQPYLKNYLKSSYARLDNNVAERALRPIAIGRKNWLFMGSESGGKNSVILMTFAQTCRALKINPFEYFEDVLRRFQDHPANRLKELLPAYWKKLP